MIFTVHIIACYSSAQSHPVTPRLTETKAANPDVRLESALLFFPLLVLSSPTHFTALLFGYYTLSILAALRFLKAQ